MPTTTDDRPLVDQLNARHGEVTAELRQLMDARQTEREAAATARAALTTDEARTAHDAEQRTAEESYGARYAALEAEDDQLLAERNAQQRQAEREADAAANAGTGITRQGASPDVYREDGMTDDGSPDGCKDGVSYWRDLAAKFGPSEVRAGIKNAPGHEDRLRRHAERQDNRAAALRAEREARASRQIDEAMEQELQLIITGAQNRSQRRALSRMLSKRFCGAHSFERRVNPSTIQGEGGYFSPPAWWIAQYIAYLRAGRVAADLCKHMDIPPGVSSVNIPKVSTPTLVAAQGANNVAVVSQDITDTSIATGFRTFTGQEDVPVQWLDFTPGNIADMMVTEDLTAAYNLCFDNSVVNGTAAANSVSTGGPLCGLYPYTNWSATNVTATQASPTAANMFGTYGVQLSQIAQARYNAENVAFLVHPRRAYWTMFGLDGASSKPFVESSGFSPFQPGAIEEQEVAEGLAYTLPSGHEVYMSKNVTTTDTTNGATAADVSIAFKRDDVWVFEDEPRARVLQEVLSGTLQVRFQIYNYGGMVVRYGGSIAIAAGSGFNAPSVNGGNF